MKKKIAEITQILIAESVSDTNLLTDLADKYLFAVSRFLTKKIIWLFRISFFVFLPIINYKVFMKKHLFLLLCGFLLFLGCHKTITQDEAGRIKDGRVYVLGNNFVVLELSIYVKDLDNIGVCFSDNSSAPLFVDSVTTALFSDVVEDSYFVRIDHLKERTTYYWRAFIQKEDVFVYGKVNRFTTTGTPSGNWTQMADFFGTAREYAVCFSIGDKGYVGTGGYYPHSLPDHHFKDFWEYDPSTNTWAQKADFQGKERSGAVGFSIGDRGYIGTGFMGMYSHNPTFLNDFWEYNPVANEWAQKADFQGNARSCAVGFSIGNKGYLGTGSYIINDEYSYRLRDFWEYNPESDTWLQKADLPGALRNWAVGISIKNKGYIGGGYSGNGRLRDFWEYDPSSNSWTKKVDPSWNQKAGAFGFSIRDKGYFGGGDETILSNDFWEYTPELDRWELKQSYLGSGKFYSVGFSIGENGYVGTGADIPYPFPTEYKDFWRFTP